MSNFKFKKMQAFFSWIKQNKIKAIFVFIFYLIIQLSIAVVNYTYIDDARRQINGETGFASSYSRWGSEIVSWIIQGGRHLTDLGWTRPILTAMVLTIISFLVMYLIKKQTKSNLNWSQTIAILAIGLNPWFLECESFRFDSTLMTISILAAIVPFLWWDDIVKFTVSSFVSVFIMCNFYQLSSGIYIVMMLTIVVIQLLRKAAILDVLKKMILGGIAYVIAMALFLVEAKITTGLTNKDITSTTKIASLSEMPGTIIRNVVGYFQTIYQQSSKIWIILFALVIILGLVALVKNSQLSLIKSSIYGTLYLALSAVFSYGVVMAFSENLAQMHPRYEYGFGFFIAIVLILVSEFIDFKNGNGKLAKTLIVLYVYFMSSFSFEYASILNYQKESFVNQSIRLSTQLQDVADVDGGKIYTNRLFKDSPILENSKRNYPLLSKLVPLNSNLYWPNQDLFRTYTGMNISFEWYRTSRFDRTNAKEILDNASFSLYEKNDKYYLVWK